MSNAASVIASALVSEFYSTLRCEGLENIPSSGPVILVANHKNQFLDGMVMSKLINKRPIYYLVAEKSLKKGTVIGNMTSFTKNVPVIRPIDRMRDGVGKLIKYDAAAQTLEGNSECNFQEDVKAGEQIYLRGHKNVSPIVVVSVESATLLKVKPATKSESQADYGSPVSAIDFEGGETGAFRVVPKIDHKEMFGKVVSELREGRQIGIFPEGGSNDRTELIALKPGVAVMALSARDEEIPVQIVPVGLDFSAAHTFRSKGSVNIGKPITVSEEQLNLYRSGDKRDAYASLLKDIEGGLRSVTINAPDRETIKLARFIRYLLVRGEKHWSEEGGLSTKQTTDLIQRIVECFKLYKDNGDFAEFVSDVIDYISLQRKYKISDLNVLRFPASNSWLYFLKSFFIMVLFYLFVVVAFLLSLPSYIVFVPIHSCTVYRSNRQAQRAVKNSLVKVDGKDVLGSQKVINSLIFIPIGLLVWAGIIAGITYGVNTDPNLSFLVWVLPLVFLVVIYPYGSLAIRLIQVMYRYWYAARAEKQVVKSILLSKLCCVRWASTAAGQLHLSRKAVRFSGVKFYFETVLAEQEEWKAKPILDESIWQEVKAAGVPATAVTVFNKEDDIEAQDNAQGRRGPRKTLKDVLMAIRRVDIKMPSGKMAANDIDPSIQTVPEDEDEIDRKVGQENF